jgi:acyl-CoA reductase-like NAD-dependent aldehyde dehydrogenase
LFINGKLVDPGEGKYYDVINPANEQVAGKAPIATKAQVDEAVAAARAAYPAWAAKTLEERQGYLKKCSEIIEANKDELAKLLCTEQGKPINHAAGEIGMLQMKLGVDMKIKNEPDRYTEDDDWIVEVRRKPVGVVACIGPWNFPAFCCLNKWSIAVALGNTCVVKPSPMTPLTNLRLAELLKDVFPPGVLNYISGDDKSNFNAGAHMSSHPAIDKLSFTGSVPTGKKIMASCAHDVKRVTLEMGGNDAAIIREDCDVDKVAPKVFGGAMANTGQVCVAIKRIYCHESIYPKFVDKLKECAKKAKVGDGFTEGVEYGPLNNSMQYNKVKEYMEDAKKQGAEFHQGAEVPSKGYFIPPTIVTGIKEGVRLVDEEQFGPVVPVMPYKTDAEAVERANNTSYGLGGSVWGTDVAKANELGDQLRTGTVWINDHLALTGAPFGGFKQSGLGREFGKADITTFTESQTFRLAKKPVA